MALIDQLSDPAAERGVLAGICSYGKDAFVDADDLITDGSFTIESNQIIYRCLKQIFHTDHQSSVDLALIYGAAKELKIGDILNDKEERAHLRAVLNFEVNLENVRKFAVKIKKLEIARYYVNAYQNGLHKVCALTGNETVDEIIGIAEGSILEVTSKLSEQNEAISNIGDGIDEHLDHIETNPVENVGIPSPYPIYNEAIGGGFRRKTINVISARMKVGKTQWADNVAIHVAGKLKIPVLNLDTEMSKEDHWYRMLANLSRIKKRDIERGKYAKVPSHKAKVREAAEFIKSMPYSYACIAGRPHNETISLIRRWVLKHVGKDDAGNTKDCLIIFDYLKLMDMSELSGNLAEYQVLGFYMTALHNICVQLDVPVLLFVQENREGLTKADTSTIGGSDRIAQLCSNVSAYKVKTEEEIAEDGIENGNRKVVVMAARHGGGLDGDDFINFNFQGDYASVVEGKTRLSILQGKERGEFEVNDNGNPTEF